MFRQVLSALFSLMERNEGYWKGIKGSEAVETFGFEGSLQPEPVKVNLNLMIELFKTGYQQFSPLWKGIFSESSFGWITDAAGMDAKDFHLSTDAWVHILYELAGAYHLWTENRRKLLDMMTPLYFARVASFVRQTLDMSTLEAEKLIEEQAVKFEEQKDYLIKVWDEKSAEKAKAKR
jgi:hypothetical protein